MLSGGQVCTDQRSLVKYIICQSKLFVKLYVPGSVLGVLNNIIYLPRQPGGDCHSVLSLVGRGWRTLYVTWSDLISFVLMLVAIITLVKHWNDEHKK